MAAVSAVKIKKSCLEVSQMLKALAHPQRLIIMGNLLSGPKSVSDLVGSCEASQSQISHFLTRMKLEGLIKAERDGRYVLYSVADNRLIKLMQVIQSQFCE